MGEDRVCAMGPPPKWYRHHAFPLVPIIRNRKPDKHNTRALSVSWLVFRAWTMDSPDFQFEVRLSGQLEVRAMVPFLIFGVFIPIMPWQFHHKFWRKAKRELENDY